MGRYRARLEAAAIGLSDVQVTIRRERPGDAERITRLVECAFTHSDLGYHGEARLLDRLRNNCPTAISLVAERANALVGQIQFSPASIVSDEHASTGLGLGPMCVLPEFQQQGIGTRLVQQGLELAEREGAEFVIVVGHPAFYRKFGFVPAADYAVTSPWPEIPRDVFRLYVIGDTSRRPLAGQACYHPAFDSIEG
jgi:putative acetyltransferase